MANVKVTFWKSLILCALAKDRSHPDYFISELSNFSHSIMMRSLNFFLAWCDTWYKNFPSETVATILIQILLQTENSIVSDPCLSVLLASHAFVASRKRTRKPLGQFSLSQSRLFASPSDLLLDFVCQDVTSLTSIRFKLFKLQFRRLEDAAVRTEKI